MPLIPNFIKVDVSVTFKNKLTIEHVEGEVITPEQKARLEALGAKLDANDPAVAEALKP